jgi:hypothetical protein
VSVDTDVRGRNVAPYHRITFGDGVQMLLAPQLVGLTPMIRIVRTGTVLRRLRAELHAL